MAVHTKLYDYIEFIENIIRTLEAKIPKTLATFHLGPKIKRSYENKKNVTKSKQYVWRTSQDESFIVLVKCLRDKTDGQMNR